MSYAAVHKAKTAHGFPEFHLEKDDIMKNQLTVTSPAFENKAIIPIQYTGRGADISPELHLSSINENAKSVAIIMDDMGHPIP
ncbi:MAG TPA: hypothetical protein DDW53_20195, partial [Lachnoclostridium sp.]|nr:hypothetical protein [Lachnoclostridium sp.]